MYVPSLDEAKRLAAQGNLVPVYREVAADLETPVSAYLKVARGGHSFLLESVEGGERLARYSFIGTEPYRVLRAGSNAALGKTDPLLAIEDELGRFRVVSLPGLPRFHGGAVGYLAYEVVRHFEPRVPVAPDDPLGLPEAIFMFTDTLLVFDHLRHNIKVVTHVRLDGDIEAAYRQALWRIDELVERLEKPLVALPYAEKAAPSGRQPRIASNMARAEFIAKVERAKEYITRATSSRSCSRSASSARRAPTPSPSTARCAPSTPRPTCTTWSLGDCQIVGASPEMLVRVEDGVVATHPIAGTRPRGATRRRTRRWRRSCGRTRRSAPSTSCWSTWAATTSGG